MKFVKGAYYQYVSESLVPLALFGVVIKKQLIVYFADHKTMLSTFDELLILATAKFGFNGGVSEVSSSKVVILKLQAES